MIYIYIDGYGLAGTGNSKTGDKKMTKSQTRKRTVKKVKAEVVNAGSFTRANSVGMEIAKLIKKGKTSVDKQELIKMADVLYASVKGKRENPSEATWLTKQIMGAVVGLGLAEDGKETLFFKPAFIKVIKALK